MTAKLPAGYRKEMVTLYLDQDLIDGARGLARERNVSASALIRQCIRYALPVIARGRPEDGLAPLEVK